MKGGDSPNPLQSPSPWWLEILLYQTKPGREKFSCIEETGMRRRRERGLSTCVVEIVLTVPGWTIVIFD